MTMDDRDGWIWFDGAWLPWREARVHVLTHTLHYGYGCFEGLRAYATPAGPATRPGRHRSRRLDRDDPVPVAAPVPASTSRWSPAAQPHEATSTNHQSR